MDLDSWRERRAVDWDCYPWFGGTVDAMAQNEEGHWGEEGYGWTLGRKLVEVMCEGTRGRL